MKRALIGRMEARGLSRAMIPASGWPVDRLQLSLESSLAGR